MLCYITHIIHCPFCSSVSQFTLIMLDIAITYISLPWTDLTLTSQVMLGVMARVANFLILPLLFKEVFYNFFHSFLFPNVTAARYSIRNKNSKETLYSFTQLIKTFGSKHTASY